MTASLPRASLLLSSRSIRVTPASANSLLPLTQVAGFGHKTYRAPISSYRARVAPRRYQLKANYSTPAEDDMGEPTGLIAKSGIELLTFGTPNGYKASILLEELKEAYGTEYTWQAINIMKNTQKEPWYTAICPNGRIPAIVDHDRGDFAVFEGLAILSYLTKHYDPDHKLSFPYESDDHSVAEQWMAWQHGGLGPMQGQANHFYRFAKDRIPYATQRYVGETERLYGVLDARLAERDFLAGPGRGTFSVADISVLGWANIAYFSGITALAAQFPHVAAWFGRCTARPAVRRGFAIPSPSRLSNETFEKRLAGGEEGLQEQEDKLKAFLEESKKQYNYKYASP